MAPGMRHDVCLVAALSNILDLMCWCRKYTDASFGPRRCIRPARSMPMLMLSGPESLLMALFMPCILDISAALPRNTQRDRF